MWVLNAVLFGLGLILLWRYHLLISPFAEIARDFGLALLIATVSATTYEIYARERLRVETLEDLLGKLIGDIVESQTWNEIREQILEKKAIRRNTQVHLKLRRLDGDPFGRFVLWILMEYRLVGLRSRKENVDVSHWLDEYMREPGSSWPRFIRVEIAGIRKRLESGAMRFDESVEVGERGSAGKSVEIEREELVYVPGSYTLVMSDLTELEQIDLWEDPPADLGLVASCLMRDQELQPDVAVMPGRVLLPGQCIEIRFFVRERTEVQKSSEL